MADDGYGRSPQRRGVIAMAGPGRPRRQHTLVFVGGLHRSGTTLLASLIAGSPEVSGFHHTGAPMDEGQHLQTVCPNDEHHGGPGRFAFTDAAHMTEQSALATPWIAAALLHQWGRYWDLSCPVLLEKSPPNLLRFRFLQRLFPGARFILIMRHPVPVSLSTRKWTPALTEAELIAHWVRAHDIAMADVPALGAFLLVRYEDLVGQVDITMKRVAAFLDIDPDFDLGPVDELGNDRYFAQWRSGGVGGEPHASWTALEAGVRRHGYSLRCEP
jgi:hypothetical protein